MKNLLTTFALALFTVAISAQESSKNSVVEPTNNTEVSQLSSEEKVCYGEQSKTAFFKSLIEENGFNMEVKNDTKLVIRSTEQIIKKSKNQILYSYSGTKGQLTDF